MRILPRFREERILREQVALVYRNYVVGMLCYFLAAGLVTATIYTATGPVAIFYWFAAATIVTAGLLIRRRFIKGKQTDPRTDAMVQTVSMFAAGSVWGALPLGFLTGEHTVEMVSVTAVTTGIMAGGAMMQSACLPVFLAFALPGLSAAAVAFFLLDGLVYMALGIGILLYLVSLIVFAYHHEATIKQSIALRFENLDLIDQLRDAMAETVEANRAKSVFLASASHDLRQPIHAIGLFTETLANMRLDPQQQNVLSHIEAASEATRDMLNTLLNFSRLDAGVVEPQPCNFRLQGIFNKLENELSPAADTKQLIYRTRETTAAVYADMTLVELILRNLITNAIRYTHKGGLLIACRQYYKHDTKHAAIEVWDTGIGISETEQQAIFREFHQLDNPERDRQKGFGLGLAIVDGLVKTMGLQIILSSRPGAGSVFRLILPLADVSIVEDIADSQTLQRFDGRRLIIIDDDESIRLAMHGLLSSWGCECLLAESAEEAVTLVNGGDVLLDLIITDYRLREDRTGREAIAALRDGTHVDLPAIIITGDTSPERLREAQACDALLLHKPVAMTELQRAMSSLLVD